MTDIEEIHARIERGRTAIAAAMAEGRDTSAWEGRLSELEERLMALTSTSVLIPLARNTQNTHNPASEVLDPIHDAASFDEPLPVLPCRVCGGRRWRLWADDPDAEPPRWRRYCCRCHPLAIRNVDGSVWCEGQIIEPAMTNRGGDV